MCAAASCFFTMQNASMKRVLLSCLRLQPIPTQCVFYLILSFLAGYVHLHVHMRPLYDQSYSLCGKRSILFFWLQWLQFPHLSNLFHPTIVAGQTAFGCSRHPKKLHVRGHAGCRLPKGDLGLITTWWCLVASLPFLYTFSRKDINSLRMPVFTVFRRFVFDRKFLVIFLK